MGCSVAGIDIEPHAASLADANLYGAGGFGEIFCRDAFDLDANADLQGSFDLVYSRGVIEHFDDVANRLKVLARYIAPGGRILTTVPNMQGLNWLLQRIGDLGRLEMHVVYDVERLVRVHEEAGYALVAAGYVGFHDAYLTATTPTTRSRRRQLHSRLCRTTSMCSTAWLRAGRGAMTPELSWLAPHVFYVGRA
jgi:2-polyprenyl-6-hydroxyphenyl methylase/3-demethylubiquinone-9 3-methyltransferase